jgi:UDP-N-acetylglucosamine diphosphorylase/glucosamine-1-phosphate N-acetyltransferase
MEPDYIILYESQHHQELFPLSRFRSPADMPTGILSLRYLLHHLFPGTEQISVNLRYRERINNNPLSGDRPSRERYGIKLPPAHASMAKISPGDKILLIHSQWHERKLLHKIRQEGELKQEEVSISGIPVLFWGKATKELLEQDWWQDLANGQDPLPPRPLPQDVCFRYPWDLLELMSQNLVYDTCFFTRDHFLATPLPNLEGPRRELFRHPTAHIGKGVVLDTQEGPIVLDHHSQITGPSYIQGPLYLGPHSAVDGAKLRPGNHIGDTCKVAGEVENSILQDFSNKHHDGFLGHTVTGSWVNWGSLANTSDLKNNYGDIRIWNKGEIIPSGLIKLGSIVGDFVKLAIGLQLNTGIVVDTGGNIFGANPQDKYLPPFLWGHDPHAGKRYDIQRFLSDADKIMGRRKQILDPELARMLSQTHEATTL